MSPKQIHRLPPNLTFDVQSARYRYRNPITGQRFWLGKDRIEAVARAKRYNQAVAEVRAQKQAEGGIPTVESIIDLYVANVVPRKPWDDGTKANHLFALELYKREFPRTAFAALDRVRLDEWLRERTSTGESFNKHRARWADLFRYAIARGVTDFNEAEAVMKMSVSRKLAENRKRRSRLSLEQFRTIHDQAPGWLQIAMELSLVTLQARAEVCRMRYDDVRDGWLYVIRDKTAGDSDMAFIRIRMTATLKEIVKRSRDGVLSHQIVHRRPARKPRKRDDNKPHPHAVEPAYLTRQFRVVRDEAGVAAHLDPERRPTFHEIRSLGGRLYREMGWTREQIRALMTHADEKMTDLYLSNPGALSDQDFRKVEATMGAVWVDSGTKG